MAADQPRDDRTRSFVTLSAGTLVSHYKIINKIGSGGMGEVYLAQDTKLERAVALKFLSAFLCADDECRRRFTREAQAAAKLDHPNIIPVYEVAEHQGRPYFAMAHVEGKSLKEFAAGNDLSIEQILELAIQICEGLGAAHNNGVIHRDIKPSNVLIDSHGRARIVDFGLAAVAGSDQVTKTGSTMGTIGYMSPEQVTGTDIDQRSDLFSLGVVLYELVTRRNPFKRDTEAATLRAVSDETPEPLARFKSDVPDALQVIVDKALEKDRSTRYQTAADFMADLKRLVRDSSAPVHRKAPARNNILRFWFIGALMLVIIIAGITYLFSFLKKDRVTQTVADFKKITSSGDVGRCDLSPDGSYFAYSRILNDRQTVVMVDDIKGGNPLKVFEADRIFGLQWSPDGEQLLIATGDDTSRTAYVLSRFGNILRHYVYPLAPSNRNIHWHPDGDKLLMMTYDSSLVTIERQSGDTSSVKLPFTFGRVVDQSSVNDRILMLAYTEDTGAFLCSIRPDGTDLQKLVPSAIGEAVFSPEGDALYYGEWIGIISRLMRLSIDPATGKSQGEPQVLIPNVPRFDNLSVSADGRRLLIKQRVASSNLYRVPLTPDAGPVAPASEALTSGTGFYSVPVLSPDGQMIAFSDYTENSYQLFIMPVTGGERRQLTFAGFGNIAGDWSPDGQELAYFRMADLTAKDIMLCVVDISSGTSRDIVRHSIMGCTSGWELDWAPAAKMVTKAPFCAGIWLVDSESGDTTMLPFTESEVAVRDPHYSPDTSHIAFYWGRDGQQIEGIWIRSLVDNSQRFVTSVDARVIGWSPDGEWIYFHYVEEEGIQIIARVSTKTAEVQTLARLPWRVPNSPVWVDLAPDASWAIVEKESSQMDVWMVENFDPHVK
ncbi:MAG: serine/threonine-protein kinase [Candidatus Zixiibacteriota bacterium]|nr:MAG: serine/threonine-protein kinase [candidate division Zixibacteria bacterium]